MEIDTGKSELFIGISCSGITTRSFAGGTICIYTSKEQDKTSGNEDAAGLLVCNENSGVLAIADGLGGIPGGDKASSSAIMELAGTITNGCKSRVSLRESILDGIEQANQSILEMGTGAATTIIAIEIDNSNIRTFHVGDSMALITGQKGKIKQQTIPHSPVGYGIEAGLIEENDAIHHDERHLISNVIGSPEMRVEIGPLMALAARDTLVLGSDGLFDNLMIDEIIEIIRCGPLEQCGEKLVSVCHDRMTQNTGNEPHKPDDMTFILFRLGKPKISTPQSGALLEI